MSSSITVTDGIITYHYGKPKGFPNRFDYAHAESLYDGFIQIPYGQAYLLVDGVLYYAPSNWITDESPIIGGESAPLIPAIGGRRKFEIYSMCYPENKGYYKTIMEKIK